jgi:hypothetical protein
MVNRHGQKIELTEKGITCDNIYNDYKCWNDTRCCEVGKSKFARYKKYKDCPGYEVPDEVLKLIGVKDGKQS